MLLKVLKHSLLVQQLKNLIEKNFFKQITDKYSYQFLKEHNNKVQNHFDSIKMEPNTKQRKSIDNFH
jgi:hypothetical protein